MTTRTFAASRPPHIAICAVIFPTVVRTPPPFTPGNPGSDAGTDAPPRPHWPWPARVREDLSGFVGSDRCGIALAEIPATQAVAENLPRRGLNPGYAGVVPSRLAALATAACRIPDMASGRKAKRVRRQRRMAATRRTSPSGNHPPRTTKRSPTPSPWAFLAAWLNASLPLCGRRVVRHGCRQLLPGARWPGLSWDDNGSSPEAPAVHAWSGLWNIWFSPDGHRAGRALLADHVHDVLAGAQSFGVSLRSASHVVNVLLYMVSVLLLWRLLRRLAVPGAWAVAAVFAVHPMHVESVAWVIGRKDLLSGLFYMAAALCWIRSMDSRLSIAGPKSATLRSRRNIGFRDLPGGAGLLTPSACRARDSTWRRWDCSWRPCCPSRWPVTLPVAFAILLWWKQRAGDVVGCVPNRAFLSWSPCVSLWPTCPTTRPGGKSDFGYGLAERVLIAARALWFYGGKLAWPTDLAVIYPLWDIDTGDLLAWGYLVAAIAVAALLWFGRHRLGRGPLAGAVFFAAALSPTLGFVDYGYMRLSFVADRYAYLAGIGVISVLIGAAVLRRGEAPESC